VTIETCSCSDTLKRLRRWNIGLGVLLFMGLLGVTATTWVGRSVKASSADVPDVVTAKRFVLVDDSGQELATLGRETAYNFPGAPLSVKLSMHSVDKLGQFSVELVPGRPPTPGVAGGDGLSLLQLHQDWSGGYSTAGLTANTKLGQVRAASSESYGPISRAVRAVADHQSARVENCMVNCN
jgi:hypothetical protein